MKRSGERLVWGLIALALLSSMACSLGGRANEGPNRTAVKTVQVRRSTATPTLTTWPPTYTPTATPGQPAARPSPTQAVQPTPTTSGGHQPAPTSTPPPPPPPPGQEPLDTVPIPELQVKSLDPHGGMSNLSTFRQKMVVQFKATDSNVFAKYYYNADVNLPDKAVHAVVKVEGTAASQLPANTVQAIWIGNRLWIKVGNQPWMPVPENVAEMQFEEQMFGVGDFLPYVPQVQRQGEETVNGIPSAHYTYSSDSLPTQYGTVSGSGDIYVALQGGYVVRFTLNGMGNFTEFYNGAGNVSLVYDTYDVGADIKITPPQVKPPRR